MTDEEYMKIAIKEAKKALQEDEIPVGAVIVYKDNIIAKAHNIRNKTNLIKDHAEMRALEKANKFKNNWRLDECTIYITLEPCPMCASAIVQSRINRIVTGAKNNNILAKKISDDILINIEKKENILFDECSSLINEFFKKKR